MYTIRTYPHGPFLNQFISEIRYVGFSSISPNGIRSLDFPRTASDIILLFQGKGNIELHDGSTKKIDGAKYVGLFDKSYSFDLSNDFDMIQVRLRPQAVAYLSTEKQTSFFNNVMDLDTFSKTLGQLHRDCCYVSDADTRLALVKQALENLFTNAYVKNQTFLRGLSLIHMADGDISVDGLATHLNTSYKSLDRWFNKELGTGPKSFIQLVRFKHILETIEKGNFESLESIRSSFGFYDRSHFNRQIKKISGYNPNDLLHLIQVRQSLTPDL